MLILSSVEGGRDNNFNLLRVTLATLVVLSHSYGLTGGWGTIEPLENILGFRLGTLSVFGFFAISGFLITRSFDRSRTISEWIAARIARIYPALTIVIIIMAFVLGSYFTKLSTSEYLRNPGVYKYLVTHFFMLDPGGKLPGVFENLPIAGYVNGPLWTIMYELICYFGLLVFGVLGLLKFRWIVAMLIALFMLLLAISYYVGLANIDGGQIPQRLVVLACPFAIGAGFYVWRDYLPLSWLVLLGLGVLTYVLKIISPDVLYRVALIATLSYMMMVLAYLPAGLVRKYNALGDYSYGIYIIAWPIQQIFIYYIGDHTPIANFAMSISVAFVFAVLSWHFIERPSLLRRHHLKRYIDAGAMLARTTFRRVGF